MKKGFTIRMGWNCNYGDTSLVITNYPSTNEIVCYPMVNYTAAHKSPSDVGMWKIKQLKN